MVELHSRDLLLCRYVFTTMCLPTYYLIFFNFLYLMNNKDIYLDLLRKLQTNPECTQRELSHDMGVSLGKINYCIKKLTEKGWIKLKNFSSSSNKLGYMYLLTPQGIEQKARLTTSFLKIKIQEFEILRAEISQLKLDENEMANERQ